MLPWVYSSQWWAEEGWQGLVAQSVRQLWMVSVILFIFDLIDLIHTNISWCLQLVLFCSLGWDGIGRYWFYNASGRVWKCYVCCSYHGHGKDKWFFFHTARCNATKIDIFFGKVIEASCYYLCGHFSYLPIICLREWFCGTIIEDIKR